MLPGLQARAAGVHPFVSVHRCQRRVQVGYIVNAIAMARLMSDARFD